MRANFATRMFRINVLYHFISWTSGDISFGQLIYRAIVKPLMLVALGFVLWYGGLAAIAYSSMAYDWLTGKGHYASEAKPVAAAPTYRAPVAVEAPPARPAPQPVPVPSISEAKPVAAPSAVAANILASGCSGDASATCISDRLAVADRQLNDEYRATMTRLTTDQKALLKSNERLWIKAKDANCSAFDGDEKTRCLLSETVSRTTYLQTYTGHY